MYIMPVVNEFLKKRMNIYYKLRHGTYVYDLGFNLISNK